MHWRQKRFVPTLVEPITHASGRTQFVPLQHFYRRRSSPKFMFYYHCAIHLAAGFGLFKLIELIW
jgi:hypothetical protein